MPCSSSQWPPSPMDRDYDLDSIEEELKLRKEEIDQLLKLLIKQQDRISKLEKYYKALLNFYSLSGNGG